MSAAADPDARCTSTRRCAGPMARSDGAGAVRPAAARDRRSAARPAGTRPVAAPAESLMRHPVRCPGWPQPSAGGKPAARIDDLLVELPAGGGLVVVSELAGVDADL